MGLALRALGNGWHVVIVQFLKSRLSGEIASLERLGAVVLRGKGGQHFVKDMDEQERQETKSLCCKNLEKALSLCASYAAETSAEPDSASGILLVLDEICAAYEKQMIDRAAVDALLLAPLPGVELVLTGRNPAPVFLSEADYITEMKKIRHPFDSGIHARRGVEF